MSEVDDATLGGLTPANSMLEAAERSKKPEDRLTEIFATVLQTVPEFGRAFWRFLDGKNDRTSLGVPDTVTVLTQIRPDASNRPDMQLMSNGRVAWIENKLFSPEHYKQMSDYADLLEFLKDHKKIGQSSELFTLRTYEETTDRWVGLTWADVAEVARQAGERLGGCGWQAEADESLKTPADLRYLADFLALLKRLGLTADPIDKTSIQVLSLAQTAIADQLRSLVGRAVDHVVEADEGWVRVESQVRLGSGSSNNPLGQAWNHLDLPGASAVTAAAPCPVSGELMVSPHPEWTPENDPRKGPWVFGGLTFDRVESHSQSIVDALGDAQLAEEEGSFSFSGRDGGVWRLGLTRPLSELIMDKPSDLLAGQGDQLGAWLLKALRSSLDFAENRLSIP